MLGAAFSSIACFLTARAIWRIIAQKCVSELYKSKSVTNRSVIIRIPNLGSDDYEQAANEVVLTQLNDANITGLTKAWNISHNYKLIYDYMLKTREWEKITKYREETAKSDTANIYPPGFYCTSRIFS